MPALPPYPGVLFEQGLHSVLTCMPALPPCPDVLPQINYNLVQFYQLQMSLQSLTMEMIPSNIVDRRAGLAQMLTMRMSDYYAMVSSSGLRVDDS